MFQGLCGFQSRLRMKSNSTWNSADLFHAASEALEEQAGSSKEACHRKKTKDQPGQTKCTIQDRQNAPFKSSSTFLHPFSSMRLLSTDKHADRIWSIGPPATGTADVTLMNWTAAAHVSLGQRVRLKVEEQTAHMTLGH